MQLLLRLTLLMGSFVCVVPSILADSSSLVRLEPAVKEIMKLTEKGFVPQTLVLKKLDSSVFFLNATRQSLASLSIDFKDHRVHCLSDSSELNSEGLLVVKRPIPPQDFFLSCFPERGSYKVTATGLDGTFKVYEGTVVVE